MKTLIFFLVLYSLALASPAQTVDTKHVISLNGFLIGSNSNSGKLRILSSAYEYLLHRRVSLGANLQYVGTQDTREWSVGPRLNYYLIQAADAGLYVGLGAAYGEIGRTGEATTTAIDLKYQLGFKYFFGKHLGASLELANYRVNRTGFYPTFGVQVRL